MSKALTAQSVEKLPPQASRQEIPDGLLPGLYLVIQPTGKKSWAVRYRTGGKPAKYTIGKYPATDLGKAREAAREALRLVASGGDPAVEKRGAAQAGRANAERMSEVVDLFIQRHVKKNNRARSGEETERLLRKRVVPRWGERRVQDIGRRDIIALLDEIVDEGYPIAANRTLAAVRKLFNWALDRSIIDASPCVRIQAPSEEHSRDRVLSDRELSLVWRAADRQGWPFGRFIQFLLLTAQRRDEVARATRPEFSTDQRLWSLPGARTKNKLAHDVPLARAAMSIVEAAPRLARSSLIFTTNGDTPISGYSKAKTRLDKLMLEIAREDATSAGADPAEAAIEPWRLHDLRRTAASVMARLGHPVHVVEGVLNHQAGVLSGVTRTYNRYQYLEEKRRALEDWAKHVLASVGTGVRDAT